MNTILPRTVIRSAILGMVLIGLQACAQSNEPSAENSVAQAFETSDVMQFKPYTRTIFSSTNF